MSWLLQKLFEAVKEFYSDSDVDALIYFERGEIEFFVYGKWWVITLKEK